MANQNIDYLTSSWKAGWDLLEILVRELKITNAALR